MQSNHWKIFTYAALALTSLLSACGGGGGGSSTATSSQLTGTAATGAALANASVAITNSAGNSPCVEASITTSGVGSFTCTLKAGEAAPFFIVVTDPTGNNAPLVSIATTTPAAGTPLTINATPLTTAIVAQLNGGDALGVVSNKSLYTPAAFQQIKSNVLAQLADVLATVGTPANYDPFTTSFKAATADQAGETADQLLDVVKITKTSSGALALSTISNSTPIVLADANTTTVAKVATVPDNVSDLTKGAQLAAAALNNCFKLPTAQRITLNGDGSIANTADACQKIVTTATVPGNGVPAFKQNGRDAGYIFYNILTSDDNTGSTFSIPEIMAFYDHTVTGAPTDHAAMNIKWVDSKGVAKNIILMAQNFAGTKTTDRPTNWWITGNQWDHDLSVSVQIRRQQEFNTAANATASRYQSGLEININGTTASNASSFGDLPAPDNASFDTVKVTGPGLPTGGLQYVRKSNNYWFAIDGVGSCDSCSTFWLARTKGLSGTDATTYRPSPTTNANWAQKATGAYVYNSTTNQMEGTRPTKGAVYTFVLYNSSTPSVTITESRTLLVDLVDPIQGVNLPWNTAGASISAALDPSNSALAGPVTSIPLDWVQNPAAELVRQTWISQSNGGYDNKTSFKLGATSVVSTTDTGNPFTDLTLSASAQDTIPTGGFREIGLNYKMLNGSKKVDNFQYYK